MKVLDINKSSSERLNSFPVEGRKIEVTGEKSFHRQMKQMSETAYRRYFADLQNRIVRQGDVLRRKPDIKELQKYRELITELLGEAASQSYMSASKNSFDRRGRHRIFVVIKSVNDKMDELTNELLKEQADNIKLLEMMDDVRGMLVDLFL